MVKNDNKRNDNNDDGDDDTGVNCNKNNSANDNEENDNGYEYNNKIPKPIKITMISGLAIMIVKTRTAGMI